MKCYLQGGYYTYQFPTYISFPNSDHISPAALTSSSGYFINPVFSYTESNSLPSYPNLLLKQCSLFHLTVTSYFLFVGQKHPTILFDASITLKNYNQFIILLSLFQKCLVQNVTITYHLSCYLPSTEPLSFLAWITKTAF